MPPLHAARPDPADHVTGAGATAPPLPPLYGLDIETDTATDGLDPDRSRVLAVAVVGPDPERSRVFDDRDESLLLDRLDWHLAALPAGVLVTWHGAGFDLPFLATRARVHGLRLGLELAYDPTIPLRGGPLPGHRGCYRAAWHAHAHLDAHQLYRRDVVPALGISGSLRAVARVCGLRAPDGDRRLVHRLPAGERARLAVGDAACTLELVARRWPAAADHVDRLPRRLVDRPRGAVSPELLRARARRGTPPAPAPRRRTAEAVR